MRAGNVKFDKAASWYDAYEEELAHFPKWAFKDQVDASAWLGDLVAEEVEAETDEDIEEYEYQRMIDETWEFGADPVTGS